MFQAIFYYEYRLIVHLFLIQFFLKKMFPDLNNNNYLKKAKRVIIGGCDLNTKIKTIREILIVSNKWCSNLKFS